MVDAELSRKIVEKVMRDLGLSDEQIALAFEDSPEGKEYMAELQGCYAIDPESILRERERSRLKAIRDYGNEMAAARSEGKAERDSEIAENMRKKGFSEEEIKLALGMTTEQSQHAGAYISSHTSLFYFVFGKDNAIDLSHIDAATNGAVRPIVARYGRRNRIPKRGPESPLSENVRESSRFSEP